MSSINQNNYGNNTLLARIVFHCPFCSERHLLNMSGTCKWDHKLIWCCCKHTIQVVCIGLVRSWFTCAEMMHHCHTTVGNTNCYGLDIAQFISVCVGTFYAPFYAPLCSYDYAWNCVNIMLSPWLRTLSLKLFVYLAGWWPISHRAQPEQSC